MRIKEKLFTNELREELHPINQIAESTASMLPANENKGQIDLANMIRVELWVHQIAERTASTGW